MAENQPPPASLRNLSYGNSYSKDQSEKKVTNVDAYISVNFSHMIKNLVPQKMYILPAFQRGILCNCVFPIIGTRAILLKLIKNEMCIKFCKHYNQHF